VRRSSLIERQARGAPRPVVSVVASAGYGKTTLLSHWAERNCQAVAWVSVDEGDNDLKVLLSCMHLALARSRISHPAFLAPTYLYIKKLAKRTADYDVMDVYEWLCDAVQPSFGLGLLM